MRLFESAKKKFRFVFIGAATFCVAVATPASSGIIRPGDKAEITEPVVLLIENSTKARAIIRVIDRGASDCASLPITERTDCVARTLRRAAGAASIQRFGVGKTARALGRTSRAIRRLPDDGSARSRTEARELLDALSAEIRAIAKTRPQSFQRYQIQVAVAVGKLKKPLRKG